MNTQLKRFFIFCSSLAFGLHANAAPETVDSVAFSGMADSNRVSFLLSGHLKGAVPEEPEQRLIYAVQSKATLEVGAKVVSQTCEISTRIIQGKIKELVLALQGGGEVTQIAGDNVRDWSIRTVSQGRRFLIVRLQDLSTNAPMVTNFNVTVSAVQTLDKLPATLLPLAFYPADALFFSGSIEVVAIDNVELSFTNLSGLTPLGSFPQPADKDQAMRFQFSNEPYTLTVTLCEKDPGARKVTWENFNLIGEVHDQNVSFILTGQANVKHPEGGVIEVLTGDAALSSLPGAGELRYEQGRYLLRFQKAGIFPIELKFDAKVNSSEGWNMLNFTAVASSLRPIALKGLSPDTQFQFVGAAKPERQGGDFVSFLPSGGPVQLQWKQARAEDIGKLFYSAQGASQIAVGPGLLREAHSIEFKVMQGELSQLVMDIHGEGEVSRVIGENILGWKTELGADQQRRLLVKLNQARKDRYLLVVQTQTPLGSFPLAVRPLRLVPAQAIRFGGHLTVVNDGAVRLEVAESRGLSQVSPELIPQSKEIAELVGSQRNQAFAYRYSGGDYSLTIQADNILPDITVSEMLLHHLGETEASVEAEMELEIREAPLREFQVLVPADYTVSRVNVAQLGDYSVSPAGAGWSQLKMIFMNPLTGRQVVQLRLEKNQATASGKWQLPVLSPQNVKSVRGYLGVSADTGLRLTPETLSGLTEIASAYFPRKVAGLQAAYRLREEKWEAAMKVERLALSIQVDATHLFTVNDGITYGSSVMNYLISGAPVSVLRVDVNSNYSNIEFGGRDVRNWKKTDAGYEIYLQAPAFGAYTLLATYDRPCATRSNTLSFVGASPLDAQSEQGSVFVVSEQQLQVKPFCVSPGLLQLDPGEIAPEHRLLFNAPILAAYRYTSRPFDLQMTLQSLASGETVRQVVDRAALETQVSREGEVVTRARYFVKSQGHSHLRISIPEDSKLWEATVNGAKVVPVADKQETLIPLPRQVDPSALLTVELKMAGKSPDKKLVQIQTPSLSAPTLLTEWNLKPDEFYRLECRGGSMVDPEKESRSGFAWISQVWRSRSSRYPLLSMVPALLLIGVLLLRWATGAGTMRGSAKHVVGTTAGLGACMAGIGCLGALMITSAQHPLESSTSLSLTAPILEAGKSLILQVANFEADASGFSLSSAWPALLGAALWGFLLMRVNAGAWRKGGWIIGWTLFCWAALRSPNGAPAFFGIVVMFVVARILWPAFLCQRRLPRQVKTSGSAAGAAALIALGLFGAQFTAFGAEPEPATVVRSVVQEARIQDGCVYVSAKLTWKAEAGQKLDFLSAPAVLTHIDLTGSPLQLTVSTRDNLSIHSLIARETGQFDVGFQYQLVVQKDPAGSSFTLPTPAALVNRLAVEIEKADVDVFSTNAVSAQAAHSKRGDADITRVDFVLAPMVGSTVMWRPQARDPKAEKAVIYGELYHLYIPSAGAVEGLHDVQVRPAQGQLIELLFQIPRALTITDVQAEFVSNWQFDPDQRLLRVQFSTPQAKPFGLRLRSQLATTPLPYQQTNGVITLKQAAGQVGMVGVATGAEVQLDSVRDDQLSAINLEDFPAALISEAAKQIPGLTLRRAFRYSEPASQLILVASAVQPDVRVETQETLSLGEDRTILASQLAVHILRSGIFKLSFVLPAEFEIESLTGAALSHWTEIKAADERIITMNLRGKTEGDQAFNISLAGPGIGSRTNWVAPRLTLREANKQIGQLVVVPELGVRLHVSSPDGVSQLDPKIAGIQQKGVLAFRLLRPDWRLGFELETVEPWIQAAWLQDVTVREGQLLVSVQIDYQIENAGVKSLPVQLPVRAENVRFEGDLIADSVRAESGISVCADWDVKLQRRVIGPYPLHLTYQLTVTNASDLSISGIKAKSANLQRGYLAVHADGRLQIQFPYLPASLQRTEWQSIPATLRRARALAESKDAFSTIETDFELPLALTRHEVARVLPARVEKTELTSVVAPSGLMLTEGRLLLHPGDKRLLGIKLPPGGQFWYAFVNGQSAWPWLEDNKTVLMLEKNSDPGKPTTVEFFYTCSTRAPGQTISAQDLSGPSFDLPLENITWRVHLPDSWSVKHWESPLQLSSDSGSQPIQATLDDYLESENARVQGNSREAESMLQMGNQFLQQGTPQQARRAYQSAWKLSQQDSALNEDARIQLHNLKMQQALLGLNQRRQGTFDFPDKATANPRTSFGRWTTGQAPDYTQQQAQQVLEKNSAEDNTALLKLAERLIRQQDAGLSKPEAIRATLPSQGQPLTFKGSLQVTEWADLHIRLDTRQREEGAEFARLAALLALLGGMALLAWLARDPSSMDIPASH